MNPGPFPTQFWKKDEEVENLQKIIDDQEDEIVDLKDVVDKQKEDIDSLKEKLEELLEKANTIRFIERGFVLDNLHKSFVFKVKILSKTPRMFFVSRRKLKKKRNQHKECLRSLRIMIISWTKS